MIDDEKYQQRLEEINIDVDTTISTYNEWLSDIEALIDNYAVWLSENKDAIVTTIRNYLDAIESAHNTVINTVAGAVGGLTDDADMKAKALNIYEDLRAYRKSGWDYS